MPKVSVLMSVYNGELYLREAVESILEQTFRDFEFIIVDDGSADNTSQILKAYAVQDSRIVLIRNEENIGLDQSLNKGLKLVQGEYVARQDADDVSLSSRLRLQTCFLDSHPEIGVLGTSVEGIDERGTSLGQDRIPIDHESLHACLLVNNCLHHSSVMIRRSLIQELGGYDERMRYVEDYDLWWRVSQLARLANLPDVLLYRRYGVKGITYSNRREMLKASLEISLRAVRESLKDLFWHEEAYKRFWWTYHGQYEQLQEDIIGLQQEDIKRLQPFWDFLAAHPAGPQIWGPRLYNLACNLLRQQKTVTGFQMLWVTTHKLKMPIQWSLTIRSVIKPYIPTLGHRLWNAWQLKQIGN